MTHLFYDHVPRTGGSAISQSVRGALGPGAAVSGALPGSLSSILKRYARMPAICCALDYMRGDALPDDRFTATMLRDPVERALSWYAFQRHDVIVAGLARPLASACRSMTVAESLASADPALVAHLSNGQARHFARMRWDGATPIDDDRLLALATEVLDGFEMVGVHEALPEFVDVLAARLGWGLLPETKVTRAASHPIPLHSLEAPLLEALRQANSVDLELLHYARGRAERERRAAFRSLVSMAAARGPEPALRLEPEGSDATLAGPMPLQEFACSIQVVESVATLVCDSLSGVEVELRNDSRELWRADGERPVRLSYHWLDPHGAMVVFDGERTRLPYDLGPGDSVRVRAAVKAPVDPGTYVLRLGMLQEGVAWFEAHGAPGPEAAVEVITASANAR